MNFAANMKSGDMRFFLIWLIMTIGLFSKAQSLELQKLDKVVYQILNSKELQSIIEKHAVLGDSAIYIGISNYHSGFSNFNSPIQHSHYKIYYGEFKDFFLYGIHIPPSIRLLKADISNYGTIELLIELEQKGFLIKSRVRTIPETADVEIYNLQIGEFKMKKAKKR